MQYYWKCEECDETNAYPDVKVCETCGAPMTPAAEQRVLREQREEAKRQAQLKKELERKRLEEQRARQEAERKRQERLKAAKQAEKERKKREQLEITLKKREEREQKIATALRKSLRLSSKLIRVAAALAVVATVVFFITNADNVDFRKSANTVSSNIHTEYLAHTVVKPSDMLGKNEEEDIESEKSNAELAEKHVSKAWDKATTQFSVTFDRMSNNIKKQANYLGKTFRPGDNIEKLFENISERISGGGD